MGSPGLRSGRGSPTASGRGSLANREITPPGAGGENLLGSGTSVSTAPLFSLAFTWLTMLAASMRCLWFGSEAIVAKILRSPSQLPGNLRLGVRRLWARLSLVSRAARSSGLLKLKP